MQGKHPLKNGMEVDANSPEEPAASGSSTGATAAAAAGAGDGYAPKRAPTQLQIQQGNKPTRSSSMYIDPATGTVVPMTAELRQYLDNGGPNIWKWVDGFKIAVFSQEASRHFSRRYWEVGIRYQSYDGSTREDLEQSARDTLASHVGCYKNVTSYADALPKLFENREIPHVIAVVEGRRDNLPAQFALTSYQRPASAASASASSASAAAGASPAAASAAPSVATDVATYKIGTFYIQGTNRVGSIDHKQNMHFYVREDMIKAVTLVEAEINSNFTVGEIQFETERGKYSVYVPHIPNAIAKNSTTAHGLLEAHAEKSGRIVVGYIGDTNYKSMMQEHSSPSTGGLQGTVSLVPASSGASKFSFFMQAVTFGPDEDYSFRMQQPTTLNHVELQLGANDKTATDHPSIQTIIILDSYIKNRDYSKVAAQPYPVKNLHVKMLVSSELTAAAAAVVPNVQAVAYAAAPPPPPHANNNALLKPVQYPQPQPPLGAASAAAIASDAQTVILANAGAGNCSDDDADAPDADSSASFKRVPHQQPYVPFGAAAIASDAHAVVFANTDTVNCSDDDAAADPNEDTNSLASAYGSDEEIAAPPQPLQHQQPYLQFGAAAGAANPNAMQNSIDATRRFKANLQAQCNERQKVQNTRDTHDDENTSMYNSP
ncbi:hypothetical protein ACD661_05405 [Legionella lytica]|uniref:Uncharacterized protein n=1 Tax=Legionella lytica TaxID=96232 RepID=A0ABW8D5L3_9GAMM